MLPWLGALHLPWIGKVPFYPFFTMIFIGAFFTVLLFAWKARRAGYSELAAFDLGIIALAASFVGSRLFHVFFEHPAYYWADPWRVLDIGRGGFVSLGAFLATFFCWALYFRTKKISPWPYLDLAACAAPIADFFTRAGCLLEGCCYGRPTTSWFHLEFPSGSTAYHFYGATWLVPTQPLFMLNALCMLIILNGYYARRKFHGHIAALYLIIYGTVRFGLEFLRGDADRGIYFVSLFPTGISTGQFVMLGYVAVGILLWRHCQKFPRA